MPSLHIAINLAKRSLGTDISLFIYYLSKYWPWPQPRFNFQDDDLNDSQIFLNTQKPARRGSILMKKKNQGDSTSMKLIGIKSVDEAFKVSLDRVVINKDSRNNGRLFVHILSNLNWNSLAQAANRYIELFISNHVKSMELFKFISTFLKFFHPLIQYSICGNTRGDSNVFLTICGGSMKTWGVERHQRGIKPPTPPTNWALPPCNYRLLSREHASWVSFINWSAHQSQFFFQLRQYSCQPLPRVDTIWQMFTLSIHCNSGQCFFLSATRPCWCHPPSGMVFFNNKPSYSTSYVVLFLFFHISFSASLLFFVWELMTNRAQVGLFA